MSTDAERYESPECWRFTRDKLLNGTAEDFARWRAEAELVQERNAVRVRARCEAKRQIEAAGFRPDYVTVSNSRTLEPAANDDRQITILGAMYTRNARLIDNISLSLDDDQ